MDHELLVEPRRERCQGVLEQILRASDLHRVAAASLAIFAPRRQVARAMLQAQIDLEAQPRQRTAVTPGCQAADARDVHTRPVSPETVCGEVCIPVRTLPCRGCGASSRPADPHLGVPEAGDVTDDVRVLAAPVVAERPHRVAHDRCQRCTGVALSSPGAQGLMDSPAQERQRGQATRATQAGVAVTDALGAGDSRADLRLESAMAGVLAPIDGRWQAAQVATLRGRRLDAPAAEPTLGAVLARRDVGLLGSAEARAVRLTPMIPEAGWEPRPRGESVGEGAPWMWTVADAHGPGVRQTLDSSHLSEPL
jgi:hypothetical protein